MFHGLRTTGGIFHFYWSLMEPRDYVFCKGLQIVDVAISYAITYLGEARSQQRWSPTCRNPAKRGLLLLTF